MQEIRVFPGAWLHSTFLSHAHYVLIRSLWIQSDLSLSPYLGSCLLMQDVPLAKCGRVWSWPSASMLPGLLTLAGSGASQAIYQDGSSRTKFEAAAWPIAQPCSFIGFPLPLQYLYQGFPLTRALEFGLAPLSKRTLATLWWPQWAATWSGVRWSRVMSSISALYCNRSRTQSRWSPWAAMWIGDKPFWVKRKTRTIEKEINL